jgi:capsular exopolysaccharide synthesis family protein
MDPLQYLRLLRRGWRILLVCVLVGLAAAWVTAPSPKEDVGPVIRSYQATRTMISTGESGLQSLAQAALFVRVGDVPQRVAARLGPEEDPAVLAAQIRVTTDSDLGTLTLSARNSDPDRAALLANLFGEELVGWLIDNERASQQAQADAAVARMDDLRGQINSYDARLAGGGGDVVEAERDSLVNQYRLAYEQFQQLASEGPPSPAFSTIEEASPVPIAAGGFEAPASRSSRLVLGLVGALVLGAALIFVRDRFDTRVRTKEIAEKVFRLPVIAEVPPLRRRLGANQVMSLTDPASAYAEAHRALRTAIMFVKRNAEQAEPSANGNGHGPGSPPRSLKVVLVTSPGPSEGKTTTVANLASSFAEAGQKVLVLSCDFRRPRVHKLLGVADDAPGISDVLLSGREPHELRALVVDTSIPNVKLLPAGTVVDNPAELLAGEKALVNAARGLADIVLIDTPPLLVANDASELMGSADITVIVARSGKTTRESALRAVEMLERLEAPALGVALVGAPSIPTSRRYYYRYERSRRGRFGRRRHTTVPRRPSVPEKDVATPGPTPIPLPAGDPIPGPSERLEGR